MFENKNKILLNNTRVNNKHNSYMLFFLHFANFPENPNTQEKSQ